MVIMPNFRRAPLSSDPKASIIVHSSLQSIALPAEDVVSVLAVASRVTRTEDEGLRAVSWPFGFVVESCGVPDDLSHVNDWIKLQVKRRLLTSSMSCGIFTG